MKLILLIFLSLFSASIFGQEGRLQMADDNTKLKLDLFSPLHGCLGFSIETPKVNGHTMDFETGFIGVRLTERYLNEKFAGGYFNVGCRFYFDRQTRIENRYFQLSGFYVKPVVFINYFTYFDEARKGITGEDLSVALMFCGGNEWFFLDRFVLDGWIGFGYDKMWVEESYRNQPPQSVNFNTYKYNYFHILKGPMVVDWGISVGILLKD